MYVSVSRTDADGLVRPCAFVVPRGGAGAGLAGELSEPALLANAVHDAGGARVHTLPITSERVWTVLRARS